MRRFALGPFYTLCREVVTDRFSNILQLVVSHTVDTTSKVQETYKALLGKKYQEHTLPRAVYMAWRHKSQSVCPTPRGATRRIAQGGPPGTPSVKIFGNIFDWRLVIMLHIDTCRCLAQCLASSLAGDLVAGMSRQALLASESLSPRLWSECRLLEQI